MNPKKKSIEILEIINSISHIKSQLKISYEISEWSRLKIEYYELKIK
jgi:hypothetical protein